MDRVERDLEIAQVELDGLRRERVVLQSQLSQIPSTSNEAIERLIELQNEYIRLSSIYSETHPNVTALRRQIETHSMTVDTADAIPLLRQQLDETDRALAEARERYTEDHYDVRALVRSKAALEDRIAQLESQGQRASSRPDLASANDVYIQLDTQIKGIDTQIDGLNGRIADLRQKRDEYQALLLEMPQVEREYLDLSRDLDNVRLLYEETQEKQRAAELALALQQSETGEQLVLVQAPSVPQSPSWPPRLPIMMLGGILSLGLGVGVGTIRETTSSTVRGSRQVLELCGAPPIALIPTIRNRANRIRKRLEMTGFATGICVIGLLAYLGAQTL